MSVLLVGLGYAAAVFGGGVFVEAALRRILRPEDQEAVREFRQRGLAEGGKIIGWLERFLALTFILAGSHAAIRLVLAAKGVIRFGEIREARDQKVAEYVLIGTMLSLSWAVLVGSILLWVG
ncbi:MAG: hypothetical protein IH608_04120 [Proteobacteria bacterium]|nr:hypothetical protein [Pseudomonadota bacterium]